MSLLDILLVTQVILSGWLILKSPFNVVSIVSVLTVFFAYIPGYIYILHPSTDFYSWRNFDFISNYIAAKGPATTALAQIGLANVLLSSGAFFGSMILGSRGRREFEVAHVDGSYLKNNIRLNWVMGLYFAFWLVAAVVLYKESGRSLIMFLLPIQDTGIAERQSGYLRSFYLVLPIVLFTLSLWKNGRYSVGSFFWISISIISTFSTHQRRELISTFLFLFAAGAFLSGIYDYSGLPHSEYIARSTKMLRKRKKQVFLIFFVGLALVPLLWYSRVYFTTWSKGGAINSFEVRSITDVLFGSSATGFPTFMLIKHYVDQVGPSPTHGIVYFATIFFPRFLWPSKPIDLDTMLQSHYNLLENPSIFWFGEIYFDYDILMLIAAFLIGAILYILSNRMLKSASVYQKSIFCVMFMQSITFFKNGVSLFCINLMVVAALLFIADVACRVKNSI